MLSESLLQNLTKMIEPTIPRTMTMPMTPTPIPNFSPEEREVEEPPLALLPTGAGVAPVVVVLTVVVVGGIVVVIVVVVFGAPVSNWMTLAGSVLVPK